MKKWWVMWFVCIPIFLVSYVYSIFITGKIAYLPQSECKPKFIFTPQDVQYCSDIYPIDVFLIALKTNPITYIWLLTGLYIIGFLVFVLVAKLRKRKFLN
ncbi:hypothetical protein GCM10010954_22250 [Halobacillus andaensis]|uniref:DUF4306 domain-containing protein n=1 Tax=Halobacillus andaensis TaxID=1176239 RepID=A0A917EYJ2_HALAA|nr:DUF4306 domain-containing protein [Halobacillus andaensis]MBP2004267.1 hypothetical protein [Halobacillus andaensis]GGF22975.1 hypothetical protein GCM10010954_22250 [Halobacillus andaensis]